MQVTEVAAEGLKREYKVTVAADEIENRMQARLQKLAQQVRMPGFRPGKAPVKLLRKQYGRSVMGEILEQTVDEGSKKAIGDHNLRPALQPKIEITHFEDGQDLEFKMNVELLPEVPAVDIESISLTRQVAPIDEEQVESSIKNLAEMRREHKPLEEPRPAEEGDEVVVDFEGSIDGEPFEGGHGQDAELVIGQGRMVPDFEEKLKGMSAGEEATIDVAFPEDYDNAELAGKTAHFKVKVKEIRAPEPVAIDDELAKGFGLESLDQLRSQLRERLEHEYGRASRAKLKRALLDHLAETYKFDVPPGMVDLEFDAIWKQLENEMERSGTSYEDMGQSEEELRAEYRSIAERRVRLGLILSDIGTRNEVKVEPQELQQALIDQARRYPGQEREVFDYFRNNQGALEQLRAPLFEDKVVDFIIERAQITEEPVSVEELMRDPDEEVVAEQSPVEAAAAKAGDAPASPADETAPAEESATGSAETDRA